MRNGANPDFLPLHSGPSSKNVADDEEEEEKYEGRLVREEDEQEGEEGRTPL